jgi:hypothetical protein
VRPPVPPNKNKNKKDKTKEKRTENGIYFGGNIVEELLEKLTSYDSICV